MATRRDLLMGTLGFGGGVAAAAGASAVARSLSARSPSLARTGRPPRNVVLILTDDQRWDSLSIAGHRFLRTPHLDALAEQGAWLREAFVTTSLCCPSRASILTGLYAHAHGVVDNRDELDPAFPTFATLLDAHDVHTAFIGKWHMGARDPHPRPGWRRWIAFRGQGRYQYPGGGDPLDRGLSFDGELREIEGYVTDVLTDLAVAEIAAQRPGQPFCLVLSHKAVHAPFTPAPRHADAYADVLPEDVPEVLPDTDEAYADLPSWLRPMREGLFGADRPYGDWPDFRSWYLDYHRTLLAVDESVGRVVQALRDGGLLDDTAVLFASDNGFLFGEQGVLDKRNFYEPSIRIPLLCLAPGLVAPGTRLDQPVLNVDLAPTILDLLGLEPPAHWHGRSFAPLLRGEAADWRTEFVYEYFFERTFPQTPTLFGLRTGRYKLATTWGVDAPDQLFDLQRDPEERHDLADDPRQADRRKALKGRMARHLRALGMLREPVWGRGWRASGAQAAEAAASAGVDDDADEPGPGATE
ncbi:MAG: sulfatase [Myxococcota bacterium]